MPLDLHTFLANSVAWQHRGRDIVVPAAEDRPQVVVTARFRDGYVGRARGRAYAWTQQAVEVRFQHPDEEMLNNPHRGGGGYQVWLPSTDVTTDLQRCRIRPGCVPGLAMWPGGDPLDVPRQLAEPVSAGPPALMNAARTNEELTEGLDEGADW